MTSRKQLSLQSPVQTQDKWSPCTPWGAITARSLSSRRSNESFLTNSAVPQRPRLSFPWTVSLPHSSFSEADRLWGLRLPALPPALINPQLHWLPPDRMSPVPCPGAADRLAPGLPWGGQRPGLLGDVRSSGFTPTWTKPTNRRSSLGVREGCKQFGAPFLRSLEVAQVCCWLEHPGRDLGAAASTKPQRFQKENREMAEALDRESRVAASPSACAAPPSSRPSLQRHLRAIPGRYDYTHFTDGKLNTVSNLPLSYS